MAESNAKLRVGLLQLESHPAVTVAGWDLLAEVNVPSSHDASLDTLARQGAPIRPLLEKNRETYVNWSRRRLQAVLDHVFANDPPDALILPECAVPFEGLGDIRAWMHRVGTNIVAGTHALHPSLEEYRPLGVSRSSTEHLAGAKSRPSVVAPVFLGAKETLLWPKKIPSIFEQSETTPPPDRVIQPRAFELVPSARRVAVLVCAEAQAMPSWTSPLPDCVVVIAYEERPERYEPLLKQAQQNQIPGLLVNDGKYGGTCLYVATDRRSLSWWDEPPVHGRLPAGDYYVEFYLDLTQGAVQVGVANPRATKRLRRFLPILAESQTLTLDAEIRRAIEERSSTTADTFLSDLERATDVPLGVAQRWRYLAHRLKAGDLDEDTIVAIGQTIAIPGLPTLRAIEDELRTQTLATLGDLIEKPEQIPPMLLGLVVKTRAAYKGASKSTADELTEGAEGALSLAAMELGRPILEDVLVDVIPATIVSGLPGCGKSSAIRTAVAQSGFKKVARIRCVPGSSADYLYESLLRRAGMMPRGAAPRAAFDRQEVEAALQAFDIIWFEDVDACIDYQEWVATELAAFFGALQLAVEKNDGAHVILESARQTRLWAPRRGSKRTIRGLSADGARLFLEQQLRRRDLHGRVSDPAKRQILDACKGHPGLLMLVAGACSSGDPERIAKELQERRGFYNSFIDGLLRRIKLATDTQKLLSALAQCRSPIPAAVFESILPPIAIPKALAEASETSMIEQVEEGLIHINPLLARAELQGAGLTPKEATDFHRTVHSYFRARQDRDPGDRLLSLIEAAYHGYRGGVAWRPAFGQREGWTGVAREAFENQDYATVVKILEPIKGTLSTDGRRYLAEAYAWTDNFAGFHETIRAIPSGALLTGTLFTAARAALHSGNVREVERILEEAERTAPGHYKISQLKGQLAERAGRTQQAELLYREACQRSTRDRWPYFYLARLLVEAGLPTEALEVVEHAKETPEFLSRAVEYALLQQEMVALVMVEEWERARAILDVLDRITRPRPEAIVAAAYVRAWFSEGGLSKVAAFEGALKQLDKNPASRHHTRAQISLHKGQLLYKVGNLADARRSLEEAVSLDEANLYIRKVYLRVLYDIMRQPDAREDDLQEVAAAALKATKMILAREAGEPFAREIQRYLYERWKLQ